jgi:hypothetical protein
MLVFNTLAKYQKAEAKICKELGYGKDSETKAWSLPRKRLDGKYIMIKHPTIKVEFDKEEDYDPKWFKRGKV